MTQNCSVIFWDVQHGHATYIRTPNNRHIVVDLGTGDFSGNNLCFSPLRHLKNNYGVHQLDYVVITHPHLDHIDDILNFDLLSPKVLRRPKDITNKDVMSCVQEKDRKKYEMYCDINNRYSEPVEPDSFDNTATPDNWGGLEIQSFTPNSSDDKNFNNHSIVTVIEYAKIKIVIPGDNEKKSLDELMDRRSFMSAIKDADILLAPHHGRESGFNNDFVNQINPKLTIVSDGDFCDTSANARYSAKSSGWPVYINDGTKVTRKCLTTNSDGEVFVNFGLNPNGTSYLSVNIR